MTALLLFGIAAGAAADFYAHWGDGKAELSSYKIVQPRYGELRDTPLRRLRPTRERKISNRRTVDNRRDKWGLIQNPHQF